MSYPLAIRPETVNVIAPLIRGRDVDAVTRVTVDSPRSYRRAMYKLAHYFLCEMDTGVLQYGFDGDETDPDHVAFLWIHPESVGLGRDFRVPCIGGTCFRLRDDGMALQWIWIHPYFRRHGLLTQAWPGFQREFGDFPVEGPISEAMRAFLAKVGHTGGVW